jgi:hypothetical protein
VTYPLGDAAHAWCAEYIHRGAACDVSVFEALLAAHQATTPSETPPTHGIVAVDELNALRADNEHLRELLDQARDAEADAYHASYEAWLGRQDGAQ